MKVFNIQTKINTLCNSFQSLKSVSQNNNDNSSESSEDVRSCKVRTLDGHMQKG